MTTPPPPAGSDRDDELASAYLDGEASASERATVDGDPRLLRRVDELRRVRDRVADPPPFDPHVRERLLATAVDAGRVGRTDRGSAGGPPSVDELARARASRRARQRTAVLSAAAVVVLLVLGGLGLLATSSRESADQDTAASRTEDAAEVVPSDERAGDADTEAAGDDATAEAAPSSTAPAPQQGGLPPTAPGTPVDLGAFADRPAAEAAAAAAIDRYLAGSAPGAPAADASAIAADPAVVACVEAVSIEDPAAGEVVWVGRATVAGQPVLVLVHRSRPSPGLPPPGTPALRQYTVDAADCRGADRPVRTFDP